MRDVSYDAAISKLQEQAGIRSSHRSARHAGKAMGLTKRTHFTNRAVAIASVGKLKTTQCKCPPGVFLDLEALMD